MFPNCCKMVNVFSLATLIGALGLVGFTIAQQQAISNQTPATAKQLGSVQATAQNSKGTAIVKPEQLETITLGAGCFWCVEAVFQEIDGVVSVTSGYSNGSVVNPTYEQVCSGNTGCAEVAQIVFDPAKVSLGKILEVFWKTHDPTSLNRQRRGFRDPVSLGNLLSHAGSKGIRRNVQGQTQRG